MRKRKLLWIWPVFMVSGIFIQTHPAYPENEKRQKLEMLIEAACQARRPSRNMRIKWTLTNPTPTAMVLKTSRKEPPPLDLSTNVVEFTAILSGSRSRIDQIDSVYKTGDISKLADAVKNTIYVFDGNTHRDFNQIRGSKVKQGSISSENENKSIFRTGLWVMGFNLCAPGVAENPNVTLEETQDPNIYIIDYLSPETGWIDRITIDAGKQYNVIKFENIKADGSYDYVIDYTYKEHPNGTWFLAGWKKIRYSLHNEPAVTWASKVEDVEFDIEVTEETFKLEYPPGTRVWDEDIHESFIVGVPDEPVMETDPLAEPEEDENGKSSPEKIIPAEKTANPGAEQKAEKQKSEGNTAAQTTAGSNYLLWLALAAVIVIVLFALAYSLKAKKTE